MEENIKIDAMNRGYTQMNFKPKPDIKFKIWTYKNA